MQAIATGIRAGLRAGSWGLENPPGWLLSGSGISGQLQLADIATPAEKILWFYCALEARVGAIAQVPLRVLDDDNNEIEDGPLVDLLNRPNQWQDGTAFVRDVEASLTCFNEAFIVPVADTIGAARPTELLTLSPGNMQPIVGTHLPTGRRISLGWEYRDPYTAETRKFLTNEIIAIVSPNPHNPLRAIMPMNVMRRTLQMDTATREANLALFLHGGTPDLVLESDQRWTPDQAREFLQRWIDNYSGVNNAHKPAILTGGLKAKPLGFNPKDLQSVEVLQQLTPHEIVAGLRVKPVMAGLMIGETGLSQGTSTEEQVVAWWNEVGLSELARIAGALQAFLVDRWDWSGLRARRRRKLSGLEAREMRRQWRRMAPHLRAPGQARSLMLWFDSNQVDALLAHRWKRIDQFDRLLGRGYQPDELNDYFDLGLPEHPTNQGLVPIGVQPVEDLAGVGEAEPGSPLPVEPAPAEEAERAVDRLEAALRADSGDPVPRRWRPVRKAFDALLKPLEKEAARRWSRFFLEQRKRVLGRLDTRRENRAEISESMIAQLFPRKDEDSSLMARLAPLWSAHLARGWDSFFDEQGIVEKKAEFQIEDPRVMQAVERRRIQGLKVNDTTEEDLRSILRDAMEQGSTMDQLSDAIAEYYRAHASGETSYRPTVAARTQTAGIVNDGRLLAAQEVGGLLKAWLHGGSQEPRPAHLAAQEQYLAKPIGLGENFVVNGHSCSAPGDSSLPASETANCTCMLTFMQPGGTQ